MIFFNCFDMKVWAYAGKPKIENKEPRHYITVSVEIPGQEKTNGYLEYSAITVRMYLFLVLVGSDTLKPKSSLLKVCVAFTKFPGLGW